MEHSEPFEYIPAPELDRKRPSGLFFYAKEKQRWIRRTIDPSENPSRAVEAIDYLVDELESFISDAFDGSLPEVTITSTDVHYPREIKERESRFIVETGVLPVSDAEAIYGGHEIKGKLYGFHRGANDDLRVYVSRLDETRRTMSGVFTPLLSIAIEGSELHIDKYSTEEKLNELGMYVSKRLKELEPEVSKSVAGLYGILNERERSVASRLHFSSPFIINLATQYGADELLLDALTEIIKLKLNLDSPQIIQTSSHRVIITERPVSSYRSERGPSEFRDVLPEVGLMGETLNRKLGVFFLYNDSAVQVPVDMITGIYKNT